MRDWISRFVRRGGNAGASTRLLQLAFPGEEPETVKPPEVVGKAILERILADAPAGEKVRVDA